MDQAPISPPRTSPTTRPISPVPPPVIQPQAPPERVSWDELGPELIRAWGYPRGEWQPEHFAIYGPTGSGKSYFEAVLLAARAQARGTHVVIVATKPADATVSALGWPILSKWPPNSWTKETAQVVFWAKAPTLDEAGMAVQRAAVDELLNALWKPQSNVIIAFDEIAYIEVDLGLSRRITRYYREGRALGISILASTQRPAQVSRYMHSESAWCVFFAGKDEDDRKRMAEVAGDKAYFLPVLRSLDRREREFLLVNNTTGQAYISSVTGDPLPVPKQSGEPRKQPDVSV